MPIEYQDLTALVHADPARPGILYQKALDVIRATYKAGTISETVYALRLSFLFGEFSAAPNAAKQIAVCEAMLKLCAE